MYQSEAWEPQEFRGLTRYQGGLRPGWDILTVKLGTKIGVLLVNSLFFLRGGGGGRVLFPLSEAGKSSIQQPAKGSLPGVNSPPVCKNLT